MIVTLAVICAVMVGCSDENATASKASVDGVLLLGLSNGHTLTYMQVDTVTTFYPSYSQTVSSQTRILSVAGTGSDWVIRENGNAVTNLKVSSPYVLQNGVWKETTGDDSLIYFPDPPIVMQQRFEATTKWAGFTPMYPSGSGDTRYPFFNTYFGFYFERTYAGKEQMLVPAGAYTVYRFDVDLFFTQPVAGQTDTLPDAVATEYYASNVGLVKMLFEGQGLNRSISLISSE